MENKHSDVFDFLLFRKNPDNQNKRADKRASRSDRLHETFALPDEGRSEYRVQYTQAGHSSGWLSGVAAPEPFSTTSEDELFSAATPPVLSSALTPLPPVEPAAAAAPPPPPLLLFLGLAKEAEEAEDEELSVLQLESWHGVPGRLGLLTAGWTRSRPEVCALSRGPRPCSFLQPKSGRRMLSMKKLVVLWACWATCRGSMGGEGRLGDGDTLSPSLLSVLFRSRCSSIAAALKNESVLSIHFHSAGLRLYPQYEQRKH